MPKPDEWAQFLVSRVDIDFAKTEKKNREKKSQGLETGPAVEQRKMSIDSQSEAKRIDIYDIWHIIYIYIKKWWNEYSNEYSKFKLLNVPILYLRPPIEILSEHP